MNYLQTNTAPSIFLTDGGLETDFIFNKNIDLPHFAAFTLLESAEYAQSLSDYYKPYLELAKQNNTGFILESPTWRANADWGYKLGYNQQDLIQVNLTAIEQLKELKQAYQSEINSIVISGQLGPRGDGYFIDNVMSLAEAQKYHELQVAAFKTAGVDQVSALTMTYTDEAAAISLLAKTHQIPVVISFTLETDGKLPSGESLEHAIDTVDQLTGNYPLYYMINCSHPSHFIDELKGNHSWKNRLKGIRANASCKSHCELDAATEIDKGNIPELSNWHLRLMQLLPDLRVFGGCCGTDETHVSAIYEMVNV